MTEVLCETVFRKSLSLPALPPTIALVGALQFGGVTHGCAARVRARTLADAHPTLASRGSRMCGQSRFDALAFGCLLLPRGFISSLRRLSSAFARCSVSYGVAVLLIRGTYV